MKLALASDKSGFILKEAVRAYLDENSIPYDDLGTKNTEKPSPFYETAPNIAPLVAAGVYDRAILICGTGMGVCILANKHRGVYAAACESIYAAKMSRAINDANILCMGGWIIGSEMGIEIVKVFLETEFLQDLENWRQTFLKDAKIRVADIEAGQFS